MQAIRRPRLALDCCATRPDNVGSPTSLPQRAPRSDKILQRVQPSLQRIARGALPTLAALAMAATLTQPAQAKQSSQVLPDTLGTIAVQQLPNEAQQTLQRIEAGGRTPTRRMARGSATTSGFCLGGRAAITVNTRLSVQAAAIGGQSESSVAANNGPPTTAITRKTTTTASNG